MLVLRPVGGLCNRMLAIASAIHLAKDSKKTLKIIWERDPLLNCAFENLFDSLETNINLEERYTKQRFHERVLRRLTHLNFSKVIYMTTLAKNKISPFEIKDQKKTLIYGANRFYELGDLNSIFTIKKEILALIDLQIQRLGSSAVGLHIRRTDHNRAISKSPLSLFIEQIRNEINTKKDVVFFLATDAPGEEETLKKLFPNKILTYSKRSLDRNSKEGIIDALVDLMCLANCTKIYGSYYSSFSFTAARFYNKPLIELIQE